MRGSWPWSALLQSDESPKCAGSESKLRTSAGVVGPIDGAIWPNDGYTTRPSGRNESFLVWHGIEHQWREGRTGARGVGGRAAAETGYGLPASGSGS